MSRVPAVVVAALLVFMTATPSRALFHLSVIDEINAKAGGNAGGQYIQVRMLAGSQNMVAHARLAVFNCDGSFNQVLLEIPSNVGHQGADVRWIAATSAAAAGGITPDFIIPANLPTSCGMVCWGAPGILPPNPPTWDQTKPANYVDCVAYSGFTGTPPAQVGTPTPLPPGDGTFSLARTSNTKNDAADFALACPAPTNNAGQIGTFGACTPPASTTTTTTTIPTVGGGCKDPAAVAFVRGQVATQCSCAAAASHRGYVQCAAHVVRGAVKAGALPKSCAAAVKRCAANSTCGRSGFVTCCRVTAKGARKCGVKRNAGACKAPKGGHACAGTQTSCCDACPITSCPTTAPPSPATPPTTRPKPTTTTTMPPYGY